MESIGKSERSCGAIINTQIGCGMLKTVSTYLSRVSRAAPKYLFAKKKKGDGEKDEYEEQLKSQEDFETPEAEIAAGTVKEIEGDGADTPVTVDPLYYKRSSQLYDKYLQTQLRPQITTDGYQINFSLIIHRFPIHLPYNEHIFAAYRDRYQLIKKAGYYRGMPQIVEPENTYIYQDQEKANPENLITHRQEDLMYAENSRFWRLTDPTINDPTSVQNRSTTSVFLIVKDEEGKWVFPSRSILEKENFEEFKKNFVHELSGNPDCSVYWLTGRPIFSNRQEVDSLPRGKGIKTFYYHALHLSGQVNREKEELLFKDHLWVPKFELGNYFEREYFDKMISSVMCVL